MKKCRYLACFCVFIFFILIANSSYAGTQEWKSLDYDVTVNEDGSMDVKETWDVWVSETNTLFKTFHLDSSKYSSITNVKVKEIYPQERDLKQIYEEQYHVDSGCFYALRKSDGHDFEIAWNVGFDSSSGNKTYEIYYTVNDVVKVYNDCTELYWQFLGEENQMYGDNITGRIKLPKGLKKAEDLRVWGHGQRTAEIYPIYDEEEELYNMVEFKSPKIFSKNMLEVRVVTEENIFPMVLSNSKNKLPEILEEEARWADIANREEMIEDCIVGGIVVVNVIGVIFYFIKFIKYLRYGSKLKREIKNEKINLEYFRDIPDEKVATPAIASYFHNFKNNEYGVQNNSSNIFSATILDLALRGFIKLEPIDKSNLKIIIVENVDIEKIPETERDIYDLIKLAAKDKGEVDIKTFKSYASKNYSSFMKKMSNISKNVQQFVDDNEYVDSKRRDIYKEWNSKAGKYGWFLLIAFFCISFSWLVFPVILVLILCTIAVFKNRNKVDILTKLGEERRAQWMGLKKYMNDFSLLKEKNVPDLIIWEKYLVYATTFGISKKVMENLKIVYPELSNANYSMNSSSYLYWAADSNMGGIGSLTSMFGSVYNSASASSSSSGSGGGFSGGGGGRRRRWPVAVEDSKKSLSIC